MAYPQKSSKRCPNGQKQGFPTCMLRMLVLAACLAHVDSFSAKLSRPWELKKDHLVAKSPSKSRRFYRIKELASRARIIPSIVTSNSGSATTSTSLSSAADNRGESSQDGNEPENSGDPSSLSSSELFLVSPIVDSKNKVNLNVRVNGAAYEQAPGIWESRSTLFGLTRPSNFPGVVLLHLLGGYLSLAHSGQSHLFKKVMFQTPAMWVTLSALLLTSATSMVINDYYDSKLGRDTDKTDSPLVSGSLSLGIVRKFLNYLYAAALICVAIVPGVPARISCVIGLMLTFWYTKHLKPMTWIKNVMCASLIALSPFTSGTAALKVANEIGAGAWGNLRVLAVPSLWRLVAMLFFGVCGREVMMDITDWKDDKLNDVKTIPVKHGLGYASTVSLICYLLGGFCAVGGPAMQLIASLGETFSLPVLKTLLLGDISLARRLIFGGIGAFMLARRGVQVFRSKGEDSRVLDRAIEEAQLAMIVCLVSFI